MRFLIKSDHLVLFWGKIALYSVQHKLCGQNTELFNDQRWYRLSISGINRQRKEL
jgi:hypothetical protein